MHEDKGLTCVFRGIGKFENNNLDWLKKSVKSIIVVNSTYYVKEIIIDVEYIVDPIINVFTDLEGTNSMVVNMGYSYYYDSKYEEERHNVSKTLNARIRDNLAILIQSLYGGKLFCFGICFDSSYVESSKSNELFGGRMGSLYIDKFQFVSNNDAKDEYYWAGYDNTKDENNWGILDNTFVYSIFPESKITLPKSSKQ